MAFWGEQKHLFWRNGDGYVIAVDDKWSSGGGAGGVCDPFRPVPRPGPGPATAATFGRRGQAAGPVVRGVVEVVAVDVGSAGPHPGRHGGSGQPRPVRPGLLPGHRPG